MKKRSLRRLTYEQRRSEKRNRERLIHKAYIKSKNRSYNGLSEEDKQLKNKTKKYDKTIDAPEIFSFIKNTNEVTKFIKKIKKCYDNRLSVFINLNHVNVIDYGAITTLLAILVEFKLSMIKMNGNFPNDIHAKRMLIESGFFNYLDRPIRDKAEYKFGKENQIITRGNKIVYSELGESIMKEVSTTIWGEYKTLKGLQRTIVELMQNTNNHAGVDETERWWLSVNHDKENKKVSFVFLDYGVGIFESLKNKPVGNKWHEFKSKIFNVFKSNHIILEKLLNGEVHMTVTGKSYRGKGLPGIREVYSRNQISNLHVIANDAFSDVSKSIYKKLENEFSGTFLYWEINEQSEVLPWNQ